MVIANHQQRFLAPIYRFNVEQFLDNFEKTVFDRVLASFDSIEQESEDKAEEYIQEMGQKYYDDSVVDISYVYEEANNIEIEYYLNQQDLREHTLRSYTTYLFHFFEKEMQKILLHSYVGIDEESTTEFIKKYLKSGVMNFLESHVSELVKNQDWIFIKNDLQLLANTIKHGQGRSFDNLKSNQLRYEKYFKNGSFFSTDNICITDDQLREFLYRLRKVCKIILCHYVQEY